MPAQAEVPAAARGLAEAAPAAAGLRAATESAKEAVAVAVARPEPLGVRTA